MRRTGRSADQRRDVAAVMADVSRRVESHGGTVRWELDEEGVVTVELLGACKGCPALPVTFVGAVRARLLEHTDVAEVRLRGPALSRFAIERIATMFGAGSGRGPRGAGHHG